MTDHDPEGLCGLGGEHFPNLGDSHFAETHLITS
jgi:hypothetical protein